MTVRRILLVAILIPLMLTFLGATYQTRSEKADEKLIPGEMVKVGGHEFHLLCQGSGGPLILLENGLWGSYPDWLYTLEGIESKTKICAYDRLGLGWSSKNNQPTRAYDVAKNLHRLIEVAELSEPTILVGFSAGGLYVREYYLQHPENIVGMMLIDSSHEQQAFRIEREPQDLSLEKFCDLIDWSGIGRMLGLFDPYVEKSFSLKWREEQLRAYNRTGFCSGLIMQSEGFAADLMEDTIPASMGALPLVVISAGRSIRDQELHGNVPESFLDEYERAWPILQKELSRLSTDSAHIIAKNSGHAVQLESPKIVIDALSKMIDDYLNRSAK
jgi:pimeloyl-ACP methyl ester carboxylesterase